MIAKRGDLMRIDQVTLQDISFTYTKYSTVLKDSLLRVGLNFPIYISRCEEGFVCSDGHKRLSAIYDILQQQPQHPKFQTIKVIIKEGARTAPPYSLHNHH